MSGSITPGLNAPTVPPVTALPPGGPTTPPPMTGLINSAPDAAQTVGSATVNPYTPNTGTASTAQAVGATPNAFNVAPDQTVSGQIQNIIASGSPLMQQAEANARNLMNQRGLINSSMGVTADQAALYSAATPIATADANIYNQAATNTTTAQNAALTAQAAATNTAGLQNAQIQTQNSQFNASAGNTAQQTAQQIAAAKDTATVQTTSQQAIANIQSNTSLSVQDKASETSQIIAGIQANTSMSNQDKQDATSLAIQSAQSGLQTYLGNLQSNTQLSIQDRSAQATAALATVNNLNAQTIANIQSNTSLSVEQQQAASAQVVAGMNNANAVTVQNLQNAAALENIKANGAINTQIQNITNQGKTILQTSASAAQLYNQVLTNLSAIMTNPNLNTAQQTTALNNGILQLKDGLAALNGIAANQAVTSNLVFAAPSSGAQSAIQAPAAAPVQNGPFDFGLPEPSASN